MRFTKKRRFQTIGCNAIDPATTTSKDWGFNPIPGKGGETTNFNPELTKKEAFNIIWGGSENA